MLRLIALTALGASLPGALAQPTPDAAQTEPSSAAVGVPVETPAGAVWSCTLAGVCTEHPNWYTGNDTAAWELLPKDYANDCDTFDYDYDTAHPDGLYASACAWISGCKTPACEGHCVANIYQDLNDQAVGVDGQLDDNQDTIDRDMRLVWALSCSLIATRVYELAAAKAPSGQKPKLQASTNLESPGMACPTDADIDSVAKELNQRKRQWAKPQSPWITKADAAVYPFSYEAAQEDSAELVASFVGNAAEAKEYLKTKCQGATVSNKLAEYVVANGVWTYSQILEDQDYKLSAIGAPDGNSATAEWVSDTGITICRDNVGMLENMFPFSIVKAGEGEKVEAQIANLPAGQCMGARYASQIDNRVPWLSFSEPGSCNDEVSISMQQVYSKCATLKTKNECVKARFPNLQKAVASYMAAHDSQVSTGKLTDGCMLEFENPWTKEKHKPHSNDNGAIGKPVFKPRGEARVGNPAFAGASGMGHAASQDNGDDDGDDYGDDDDGYDDDDDGATGVYDENKGEEVFVNRDPVRSGAVATGVPGVATGVLAVAAAAAVFVQL